MQYAFSLSSILSYKHRISFQFCCLQHENIYIYIYMLHNPIPFSLEICNIPKAIFFFFSFQLSSVLCLDRHDRLRFDRLQSLEKCISTTIADISGLIIFNFHFIFYSPLSACKHKMSFFTSSHFNALSYSLNLSFVLSLVCTKNLR